MKNQERKTSRQIQAENTKKHILDTVTEILREKTYEEMSLQEICRRAGVSVGSFYHHFSSKAALIESLYMDCDAYFETEVLKKVQDLPPVEAVVEYICCQVQYGMDTGIDAAKNIYKAQIDNGNEFFLSKGRGLPQGLGKLLRKVESNGLFIPGADVEEITGELLIISRGILYNWCVSNGEADMKSQVRTICANYLEHYLV